MGPHYNKTVLSQGGGLEIPLRIINFGRLFRRTCTLSQVEFGLLNARAVALNLPPSRAVGKGNGHRGIVAYGVDGKNDCRVHFVYEFANLTVSFGTRGSIAAGIVSDYVGGSTYMSQGDI